MLADTGFRTPKRQLRRDVDGGVARTDSHGIIAHPLYRDLELSESHR
jgi:hypothetical protein